MSLDESMSEFLGSTDIVEFVHGNVPHNGMIAIIACTETAREALTALPLFRHPDVATETINRAIDGAVGDLDHAIRKLALLQKQLGWPRTSNGFKLTTQVK